MTKEEAKEILRTSKPSDSADTLRLVREAISVLGSLWAVVPASPAPEESGSIAAEE